MQIPCPYCGKRDEAEFEYGGTAQTPLMPQNAETAAWPEQIYLRDNPRGPHAELWFHAAGCQHWLTVTRDTRDNRILGTALHMAKAEPKP